MYYKNEFYNKWKKRVYSPRFEWKKLKFWRSDEWRLIRQFLDSEKKNGIEVCPSYNRETIFRSLRLTPFKDTKIIILGQDPYYTKGVADGLAFSILPSKILEGNNKIPRSLETIFSEYREDLGFPYPRTGDLSTWARNGVLLLNTIWTVQAGKSKTHDRILGRELWQELTAQVLTQLSNRKDRIVFILWGNDAKSWRHFIDEKKHLVLTGCHPSPRLFSHKDWGPMKVHPFMGGKYFSKACEYLDINTRIWRLP